MIPFTALHTENDNYSYTKHFFFICSNSLNGDRDQVNFVLTTISWDVAVAYYFRH